MDFFFFVLLQLPATINQSMEITFVNAIELLAAFQAFLFAAYLLTMKTGNKSSNFFIAFFLVLMGLNLAHNFIDYYLDSFSNLYVFLQMTIYLAAPSLFLYIQSSIDPGFKIKWKTGLHLLPWIAFNLAIIPSVYLVNITNPDAVESDSHAVLNNILFISFYLQNFIYLGFAFSLLKRFKRLYDEGFSNTDIRKYHYLIRLNSLVFIVFIVSAIKNFMLYNYDGILPGYAVQLVLFLILVLFCWIIIKGLQSPELFRVNEDILPPVKAMVKQEDADHKLKLQPDADRKLEQVKSFMDENEPYLDASLSLHDLARQSKIPSRELSLLINHYLNKHFFDFVNEYRIDKAKQFLTDPEKEDFTVLEILYDVGFNSKSSFNTAFKKHTGITPTQFRKSNLKSVA